MQLGPEEKRNLEHLIGLLDNFRKLDTEMPIQHVVSFLNIALNEEKEDGFSVQDLENLIHLSQSATSRNVQALSKWFKPNIPGHDLVESYENPMDRRKKVVRLNAKGRSMATNVLRFLERMNAPKAHRHAS
jgi:DNA-binding MarR family transcriptional regulator